MSWCRYRSFCQECELFFVKPGKKVSEIYYCDILNKIAAIKNVADDNATHWLQDLESLIAVWVGVVSHPDLRNQAATRWSLTKQIIEHLGETMQFLYFRALLFSAEALVRWGEKIKYVSIAVFLSNMPAQKLSINQSINQSINHLLWRPHQTFRGA